MLAEMTGVCTHLHCGCCFVVFSSLSVAFYRVLFASLKAKYLSTIFNGSLATSTCKYDKCKNENFCKTGVDFL